MKLTFRTSESLKEVCKTAFQNGLELPYGQGPADDRGVWLVNDAGVYLMPANCKGKPKHIAYAQGFKDEGLYGDDFAEFIPLSLSQLSKIVNFNRPLQIEIQEDSIKISA